MCSLSGKSWNTYIKKKKDTFSLKQSTSTFISIETIQCFIKINYDDRSYVSVQKNIVHQSEKITL